MNRSLLRGASNGSTSASNDAMSAFSWSSPSNSTAGSSCSIQEPKEKPASRITPYAGSFVTPSLKHSLMPRYRPSGYRYSLGRRRDALRQQSPGFTMIALSPGMATSHRPSWQ